MPEKKETTHKTHKQTWRALKLNSIGPSHNNTAILQKKKKSSAQKSVK